MALTKGFENPLALSDHFTKHGARLGIADETTYLARAANFLGSPTSPTAHEFRRPWNDDIVRYDSTTEEFGVLGKDGYIKTYFKPDPATHGFQTNGEYFEYERSSTK